MFDGPYPFLNPKFLEAMNDISRYGFEKHGENSFEGKRRRGDLARSVERHQTNEIIGHGCSHGIAYVAGVPHDHFNDLLHQLAAMAINAMVEAEFAGLVPADQIPQE